MFVHFSYIFFNSKNILIFRNVYLKNPSNTDTFLYVICRYLSTSCLLSIMSVSNDREIHEKYPMCKLVLNFRNGFICNCSHDFLSMKCDCDLFIKRFIKSWVLLFTVLKWKFQMTWTFALPTNTDLVVKLVVDLLVIFI